jgi:hypothetical protein
MPGFIWGTHGEQSEGLQSVVSFEDPMDGKQQKHIHSKVGGSELLVNP